MIHLSPEYDDLLENVRKLDAYAETTNQSEGVAPSLNDSMKLQNISYRCPDTEQEIISGLSVEIKKNQTIALTGPSGIGKSTLSG